MRLRFASDAKCRGITAPALAFVAQRTEHPVSARAAGGSIPSGGTILDHGAQCAVRTSSSAEELPAYTRVVGGSNPSWSTQQEQHRSWWRYPRGTGSRL